MAKEIKFSLLYRDMWQSSGKYVPRVDQLVKVAGPIVDMGCFARVETNGGGFEQINLLFGENPNKAVRDWTRAFNQAGIQTHMLERGLNGLRMSPVPADVRRLMYKVKKKQGTDIARSFDGLNDVRNLEKSIVYAKEGGMVSQAALSLTYSEVHTVDYYLSMADTLIEMGTQEICIKDMAGIGRPVSVGRIIQGIKTRHPEIPVTYHGHSGPGFSVASILEAARAGVDYVDVAMEPLSWGTGHADLLTVHEMLRDAGYKVPSINMKAYMKVRTLTQEFIDDFLGLFISNKNRFMNSLLIGPGLPGGMMGSLMSDLENNLSSLNKWLEKNGKDPISQDELLIKLFEEVAHIWPKLGYPPLVTPYSQYVKNVALMNVMQMEKGKARWSMVDDNTWDMISGKSGKLPGTLAQELVDLAKQQNREFFEGDPQTLVKDQLPVFRKEMDEKGWEYGQDDEELFELAMHPSQYRDYKSGKAKQAFEEDVAKKKSEQKTAPVPAAAEPAKTMPVNFQPKKLNIDVNGEKYIVSVSYDDAEFSAAKSESTATNGSATKETVKETAATATMAGLKEILAPVEGKFFLTKNPSDPAVKVGQQIKEGQVICYIESMKVYNAVTSDVSGEVIEISRNNGDSVEEDEVLIRIK
jgi:pyruvate carboxylase subunit B